MLGEILLSYIAHTSVNRPIIAHNFCPVGRVGTCSVRGVLAPGAVASSRMLPIRCRAWLDRCSADNFFLDWVVLWRQQNHP